MAGFVDKTLRSDLSGTSFGQRHRDPKTFYLKMMPDKESMKRLQKDNIFCTGCITLSSGNWLRFEKNPGIGGRVVVETLNDEPPWANDDDDTEDDESPSARRQRLISATNTANGIKSAFEMAREEAEARKEQRERQKQARENWEKLQGEIKKAQDKHNAKVKKEPPNDLEFGPHAAYWSKRGYFWDAREMRWVKPWTDRGQEQQQQEELKN